MKLKIGLTKVYEAEGEIKALAKDVVAKRKLNKKGKKGKSDKSSRSSKKAKPKKFSQELTEEELSSIENGFCPRIGKTSFVCVIFTLKFYIEEKKSIILFGGEPYFEVLGEPIEVSEVAKKVAKIRFGLSPPPPKAKVSKTKKGSDKRSGARSTRSKSSTRSGEKKEKGAKGKKKVDPKKYVAKYNVTLGSYTVVKEIIIIGSFK